MFILKTLLLLFPSLGFGASVVQQEQPIVLEEIVVEEHALKSEAPTALSENLSFKDLPHQSLDKSLGTVPSLLVQRSGGAGSLTSVKFPGTFHPNQSLITLDGIPLNMGRGLGVDLSQFPASWFEGAEIITGANAVLYGGHAIGGVLNFQPKEPDSGKLTELNSRINSALSSLGGVSVGTLRDNASYIFGADLQTKTPMFSNDKYWGGFQHGGVKSKFGENSLTVSQFFSFTGKDLQATPSYPYEAYQEWLQHLTIAKATTPIGIISLAHRFSDLKYNAPLYPSESLDHSFYFVGRQSFSLAPWSTIHARVDSGTHFLKSTLTGKGRDFSLGSGISHDATLFDDRLILSTGARYDYFNNLDMQLSYRGGARVYLYKTLSLFSNYGTSFTPPTMGEKDGFPGFNIPTPDLNPATARSVDIGVEREGERYSFGLRFFKTWHDDLIVLKALEKGLQYQNIQNASVFGFTRSMAWNIFPWLNTSIGWASQYASDERGRELPYFPKHRGTFGITIPWKNLKLGANYLFRGRMHAPNGVPLRSNHDVGVSVVWNATEKLSVELQGTNLLNLKREEVLEFPLPGVVYGASLTMTL